MIAIRRCFYAETYSVELRVYYVEHSYVCIFYLFVIY